MKLLTGLTAFLFAGFAVLFAMSNPGDMALRIWPVPYVLDVPAFLVLLAGGALGVLWGGFAAWSAGAKTRRRLRQAEARAETALRDVRRLERALEKAAGPPAPENGESESSQSSQSSQSGQPALPARAR